MKHLTFCIMLTFLCGSALADTFSKVATYTDQSGYLSIAVETTTADLDKMFDDAQTRIKQTAIYKEQCGSIRVYYIEPTDSKIMDDKILEAWVNRGLTKELSEFIDDKVVAMFLYEPCIILRGEEYRKLGWFKQ